MKKLKILSSLLITGSVVTVLGVAVSRKSETDIDLKKNIVVISEEKNSFGIRSFPMDKFWSFTVDKWKLDFPEESKKFNIIIKHGDQSAYEELTTLGVTAQSMPDVWFFPSNRLPYLLNNSAVNPLSENDKKKAMQFTNIDYKKGSYEQYGTNDYGVRFKMETVFLFMNKDRLSKIYHNNAHTLVSSIMKYQTDRSGYEFIEFPDGKLKIDSAMTIDNLFKHIESNSISEKKLPFKVKHKNVAKYVSDNLDLTKVANEMASSNTSKRSLFPINGANKWWANSFVYANGTPKKGGLIWEQDGKPTSQLMDLSNEGSVRDVMSTFFKLATKGPKDVMANDGTKNKFMDGLTAFTISGTWDNDRFIDSFSNLWKEKENPEEFIDSNLFAIALPIIINSNKEEKRLKHYIQGKSLGINSRNEPNGEKYKASLSLISEVLSADAQKLYASSVEDYVPANYLGESFGSRKSFIKSVLDVISEDEEKRTVKLSDVSELYESLNFGQIWEDITHPLAADLSGNISLHNYDTWASGVKERLKQEGFVEPNDK